MSTDNEIGPFHYHEAGHLIFCLMSVPLGTEVKVIGHNGFLETITDVEPKDDEEFLQRMVAGAVAERFFDGSFDKAIEFGGRFVMRTPFAKWDLQQISHYSDDKIDKAVRYVAPILKAAWSEGLVHRMALIEDGFSASFRRAPRGLH